MDDLISRKAAIDALAKFVPYVIDDVSTESYTNGLTDAYNLICQLPPAQPERKKGHWIEVDDHYNRISGRCSACGWESHLYEDDVVGMHFCPNCGSYNGGEQDESI